MEARGPFSVPRATVVWGVDVSTPRTITSRAPRPNRTRRSRRVLRPRLRHRFQTLPPRRPGRAGPGHDDHPSFVLDPGPQLDLQVLVREEPLDGVPPLHEGHPVGIEELLDPEVDDLLDPVQPVHVEMVDGKGAAVLADERERG